MYKKILLAYDATEHGEHALAAAIDLAVRCQAHLIVLTVIEDLPRYAQGTMDGVDEYLEGARTYLDAFHQKARQRAQEAGVPTDTAMVPGHVVETVVRLAKQEQVDLIVLGGVGRSHLLRKRTGVQIYLNTPCPLLVVH